MSGWAHRSVQEGEEVTVFPAQHSGAQAGYSALQSIVGHLSEMVRTFKKEGKGERRKVGRERE